MLAGKFSKPLPKSELNATRKRSGAVMVLLALLLPVLFILAAFVINVAYLELSSTELYVASDAAARAGGRVLIVSGDQGQAIAAAKRYAELNRVSNNGLTLADSDIVFGRSLRSDVNSRYEFTPGGNPNSMRILANRSASSPDGPINAFTGLLSTSSVGVSQVSTSTQVEIDMALCIDKSGSMAGVSIDAAREALHFALDGLRASDTFNIVAFDHEHYPLFQHAQPA
ncbi:MAG: pilus assembly protein TadG-related protein, partial [Planctomycetota bacterium]